MSRITKKFAIIYVVVLLLSISEVYGYTCQVSSSTNTITLVT